MQNGPADGRVVLGGEKKCSRLSTASNYIIVPEREQQMNLYRTHPKIANSS
jgi:hypothetical protein